MKTACLLLVTIGCAGLMHGIACAATFSDGPPQTERAVTPHPSRQAGTPSPSGTPRARLQGRRTTTLSSRERAGLQGGKSTILSSRERTGLQGGDHGPLPRGEGGPASAGPGEGSFGTVKRVAQTPLSGSAVLTVPVRPPSVVRPSAATSANVRPGARSRMRDWSAGRHRGLNPATVSGLGNRTASNTGSIDGTRMHRRP